MSALRPATGGLLAGALLATLVAGCFGDPDPPPVPTQVRVPTIIGMVKGPAPDGVGYELESGDIVHLRGPEPDASPATRLSRSDVQSPGAPDWRPHLLLVGEDELGAFYAATDTQFAGDCLRLIGEGYIEEGRAHLSSGLVVLFAEEIEIDNDRGYYDESWLLSFDRICLDADGRVIRIEQLPLGA